MVPVTDVNIWNYSMILQLLDNQPYFLFSQYVFMILYLCGTNIVKF